MSCIARVILHCVLVSPEATVVVALDHGPPRMRVPLANIPPHEYVLLTLFEQVYSGKTYYKPLIPLTCIGGYVEPK